MGSPSRTHASAAARTRGWFDERAYAARRSAELSEAIDRNCRLMELARHNGFEIDTKPLRDGEHRLWMVPELFVGMVGYHAAVVR